MIMSDFFIRFNFCRNFKGMSWPSTPNAWENSEYPCDWKCVYSAVRRCSHRGQYLLYCDKVSHLLTNLTSSELRCYWFLSGGNLHIGQKCMFTSQLFRSERNYQTLHRRKALATLGTHFVFVLLKHFCLNT